MSEFLVSFLTIFCSLCLLPVVWNLGNLPVLCFESWTSSGPCLESCFYFYPSSEVLVSFLSFVWSLCILRVLCFESPSPFRYSVWSLGVLTVFCLESWSASHTLFGVLVSFWSSVWSLGILPVFRLEFGLFFLLDWKFGILLVLRLESSSLLVLRLEYWFPFGLSSEVLVSFRSSGILVSFRFFALSLGILLDLRLKF